MGASTSEDHYVAHGRTYRWAGLGPFTSRQVKEHIYAQLFAFALSSIDGWNEMCVTLPLGLPRRRAGVQTDWLARRWLDSLSRWLSVRLVQPPGPGPRGGINRAILAPQAARTP